MASKLAFNVDFSDLQDQLFGQFRNLDSKDPSSWPAFPRYALFTVAAVLVVVLLPAAAVLLTKTTKLMVPAVLGNTFDTVAVSLPAAKLVVTVLPPKLKGAPASFSAVPPLPLHTAEPVT